MSTRYKFSKFAPKRLELAAGEHHSLAGVRGTVVRVQRGRVWITQEGDLQDYVVPELARFESARQGMLVVSALEEGTTIKVYQVDAAPATEWIRSAVRIEPGFVENIERAARREAALVFARAVCRLWRGLRGWWGPRFATLRGKVNRRGYHC